MTAEDLAYEMAVRYGRSRLGDRLSYVEWLSVNDLPSDDIAVDDFERMHAVALEELRE